MRSWLVSYRVCAARYSLTIKADTWDDARAHVAALAWATLDGEVMLRVGVVPGWLARLAALFGRLAAPRPPREPVRLGGAAVPGAGRPDDSA